MPRLVLTFVTLLFATAAHAQAPSQAPGFFDEKPTTWAPRGQLSPLGTEVRDIPIKRIRADWCGATEYTKELFGKELVENGKNALDEYGLSFSLDGSFDGSGVKQTALVGNYETCRGRRGRFVLIIDSDTRKVASSTWSRLVIRSRRLARKVPPHSASCIAWNATSPRWCAGTSSASASS